MREQDDRRLLGLIQQAWLESGGVYGYRKVHSTLRAWGESCGHNRVARLMKQSQLNAQIGYKKQRYRGAPLPKKTIPNHLNQAFDVQYPNQVWVSDITYIRTHEGWLYLAVVLDLFSRQIVGWSMQSRLQSDIVLDALLMAVWRRRPTKEVLIHSDQGAQYTSEDWQALLKAHGLKPSMSRRGHCYDNAVAESFFSVLKKERIKRRIYTDRTTAKNDIFDYIEVFYNRKRSHGYNAFLSPVEYEKQFFEKVKGV